VDPFEAVAEDMQSLNANIKAILGVDHPVLHTVARYFFDFDGGKKMRPALVLLMSKAANAHMAAAARGSGGDGKAHAAGVAPAAFADNDGLPPALSSQGAQGVSLSPAAVVPLQERLAEIVEMIHTASLLHDDVIDMADTRRGAQSVNNVFGNKLAVLAGDFLLARASVSLSRLRSIPVVEIMSLTIENLVKGEVMQMRTALRNGAASQQAFEMYLRKSYYKTGSLIANGCKAAAILGRYPPEVCEAAFKYGLHVGLAFQLVDDLLDFEGTAASLGKPAMADLQQGLATAPVLFAAQVHPTLLPLIERKFETPGDVDAAVKMVSLANGTHSTRVLAIAHGQMALEAIAVLEPSLARTALASLVSKVITRTK
jgi:geranylgeranyl pyrophosphate synthase